MKLLYAALILVTFVTSLLFLAPARIGVNMLASKVGNDIRLHSPTGRIWNGSASLEYEQVPSTEVTWLISIGSLISAAPKVTGKIRGQFHDIDYDVVVADDTVDLIDLSGNVSADAVNPFIDNIGFKLSGDLTVEAISGRVEQKWATDLTGEVEWSGGSVLYRTARSSEIFELPPLFGSLVHRGDKIGLALRNSSGEEFLSFELNQEGWGKVALRRRLFDLSGQAWPVRGDAEEVVVAVEEKLW